MKFSSFYSPSKYSKAGLMDLFSFGAYVILIIWALLSISTKNRWLK
ncbi:hypothetical protein J2S10_001195 [Neobacillus ginsengisoli]|uniref:Uncharacterized protein n=1 Tax=Neobacillus ginsengisoli TaxID=904295 RepID=A0ABT9XR95_9BACI|nr:hypothetical protein [Neobacillus ginsengisoli]